MSTDLITAPLIEMAKLLAPADLLPKHLRGKPADVFLTLQLGQELGLQPMQSIRAVHVIEGKPTMSADLMSALCQRRRDVCEYLRPVELSEKVATYETKRIGWPEPMRLSFSMADAERAGLLGKDNWRKYPAAMLKARCLSAIVRAAYPDLMLGIYDPDELDAPAAPSVIDAKVVDVSGPTPHARRPLQDRIAAPAPAELPTVDEAKVLRDELATIMADIGEPPSALRAYLIDTTGREVPPVGTWDAERLRWAVKQLRNGMRQKFRAWLDAAPPEPAALSDDPRPEPGLFPDDELPV